MKRRYLFIPAVLFVGLAAGCQSSTDRPAAGAQKQGDSNEESTRPLQTAEDFSYAQKDEFVEEMQGTLTRIQKELDRLTADVATARGAAKAEAEDKVRALREEATRASQQLEEAKTATEATWGDVKGRIRRSLGELEDSFQQTRQWLSDQLES
jgi:peptidoglycan hydrolase CwlO-like protein